MLVGRTRSKVLAADEVQQADDIHYDHHHDGSNGLGEDGLDDDADCSSSCTIKTGNIGAKPSKHSHWEAVFHQQVQPINCQQQAIAQTPHRNASRSLDLPAGHRSLLQTAWSARHRSAGGLPEDFQDATTSGNMFKCNSLPQPQQQLLVSTSSKLGMAAACGSGGGGCSEPSNVISQPAGPAGFLKLFKAASLPAGAAATTAAVNPAGSGPRGGTSWRSVSAAGVEECNNSESERGVVFSKTLTNKLFAEFTKPAAQDSSSSSSLAASYRKIKGIR